MPLPFSVLDLSSILTGSTAAVSYRNTLALARHTEELGFRRYWVAEHHNMPGIASSATSVLIGYIAGGTSSIRVGSGGIMLPNHAPLVIAEQFGTLESMYPGRIDLGLGRAPGTDPLTAAALRRGLGSSGDTFPRDLLELQSFLKPEPGARVRAYPGNGLNIPIYLLGSSDFSAALAAELGLPFAFASHFAPDFLQLALKLYRTNFKPSDSNARPYTMVAVTVVAAETDDEANYLFTSLQQRILTLIRGTPGTLPPPVQNMDGRWNEMEEARVNHMTHYSAVGSKENVREKLQNLIEETAPDELIITGDIYDQPARLRSYQLVAEIMRELNTQAPTEQQRAPVH